MPRGLTRYDPGPASLTRSPTRVPTVPESTMEYSSSRECRWGLTRVPVGMLTSSTARLPTRCRAVDLVAEPDAEQLDDLAFVGRDVAGLRWLRHRTPPRVVRIAAGRIGDADAGCGQSAATGGRDG